MTPPRFKKRRKEKRRKKKEKKKEIRKQGKKRSNCHINLAATSKITDFQNVWPSMLHSTSDILKHTGIILFSVTSCLTVSITNTYTLIRIGGKSVRSWCDGSLDRSFMVDSLSYFSFQPVLHDWCKKGSGMCNPDCGMVHIKEPLLLI